MVLFNTIQELVANLQISKQIEEKSPSYVLLFNGQGSQETGMLDHFLQSDVYEVQKMLKVVDKEVPGFIDLISSDNKEKIDRTDNAQVAVFIANMCALATFQHDFAILHKGKLPRISATAGFSLGEYSALVVGGYINFQNALRLVVIRGKCMEYATRKEKGSMANCQGLSEDDLIRITNETDVTIGNYLFNEGYVVAGKHDNISTFVQKVIKMNSLKVKSKILSGVSGAFHSEMMNPALPAFRKALHQTTFQKPEANDPIVFGNVTGKQISSQVEFSEMLKMLEKQMVTAVKWKQSMDAIVKYISEVSENKSFDSSIQFVSVGPGNAVKSLLKKAHPSFGKSCILAQ